MAFTKLSQWFWSRKHQEEQISTGSSSNSLAETCLLELDIVRLPLINNGTIASSSRKIKGKWQSREEWVIDKEHDVVVVPSDGECISGSESDSDWSIGWLEPYGPGFPGDDEFDSSFAVIVPCYRCGHGDVVNDPTSSILNAIGSMPGGFSPEGKKYMEQLLSSLQAVSAQDL